jgi:streptogramin lyase
VCPTDGQVVAIDIATGSVDSRIRLPGARVAELGGSGLWVTFARGVAQLAVPNLSVLAVYDVPVGSDSGLFAADDAVWVRTAGREMLTRIDLASKHVDEIVTSTKYQSIGDLIVVGDDVWTTASDDSILLRVSAR